MPVPKEIEQSNNYDIEKTWKMEQYWQNKQDHCTYEPIIKAFLKVIAEPIKQQGYYQQAKNFWKDCFDLNNIYTERENQKQS